jgi:hypothetical protein
LETAGLVVLGTVLNRLFGFPFAPPEIGMGLGEDVRRALPLFIAMLVGMLAQYCYSRFEHPHSERKRLKWDWGLFVAPVFASPIIFIPLLAAFLKTDATNQPDLNLMILLVAFQNGFFWKEHYDRKRTQESKTP